MARTPIRHTPSTASTRGATPVPRHGGPSHSLSRRWWLFALGLWLATLLAYQPAWRGGVLWDDDVHLTRAELQPVDGLARIWTDVRATPQYYPIAHSAFWLQHRAWGDNTLGYHVVNISLHALSAILFAVILTRLGVPGARLAALIFALHPVHVESVAWMTELKNTLSGTLYLSAALIYLRFDEHRRARDYTMAAGVFVLALFSKSVTASLPAALLLAFWWRRRSLSWRRDVVPLLPFFGAGAAAGWVTVWIERTVIGAQGAEFSLTVVERSLVAGRAIVFYLGKLLWPANLIFVYPRWSVSALAWWQFVYPLMVLLGLGVAWALRKRTRAPLAALLFFCGTLFPALGFIDVYPFRYSFVADHFQYLASLGVIALAAAGLTTLARRSRLQPSVAAALAIGLVGAPLAVLTWRQSRQYVSAESLYRATLAADPSSWMAHDNLGELLLKGSPADVAEAAAHFRASVQLRPNQAETHNNLGLAWQHMGRLDEARTEHQTAVRLDPGLAVAHYNLGIDFERLNRPDDALREYEAAVTISPGLVAARHGLGALLQRTGRSDRAVDVLTEGVRIAPASPEMRVSLGMALHRSGRIDDAIAQYQEALRLRPDSSDARNDLGVALVAKGRFDEALREYRAAEALQPGSPMIAGNMGYALLKLGRVDESISAYRDALAREGPPGTPATLYQLGVALARGGRLQDAAAAFGEALRLQPDFAEARSNLAQVMAAINRR